MLASKIAAIRFISVRCAVLLSSMGFAAFACSSDSKPPNRGGSAAAGSGTLAGEAGMPASVGGGGEAAIGGQSPSEGGDAGAGPMLPPVQTDDDDVEPLGLVPKPASATLGRGHVLLSESTRIAVTKAGHDVGDILASVLRRSTGLPLEVTEEEERPGDIVLRIDPKQSEHGAESYRLEVTNDRAILTGSARSGLFYATTTLRQLLDPRVEARTLQAGVTWRLPRVVIDDYPRFAWRGLTFDVARHFFGKSEVARLIDLAAYHKLNRFHLHLTDDQGWRIQIDSWPELTNTGASTQVGGGPGGFYTKADYAQLVAYAQERFITVIPEIDMPGHTNAALASYASLNESGVATQPYTGTTVGLSSLAMDSSTTIQFVTDVLGEVAAMTPGPYLHVGGDEAKMTDANQYKAFMAQVAGIVKGLDKTLMGWCEVSEAPLPAAGIAQHWTDTCPSAAAASKGMGIVLSPATHAYLDQKYSKDTPVGHDWAGYVSVQQAYDWPQTLSGVPDAKILGIDSALWTEFVTKRADIDLLMFPRLAGHAELGWSDGAHDYADYAARLPQHGARLQAAEVEFFRAPEINWLP